MVGARRLLVGCCVFAATAATAQTQDQAESAIVVTGQRLADSENALQDCLSRECPPAEDIAATLAHAENLFIAGEYRDARQTLRSGIKRNRRHRSELPDAVAGLYRANSRISRHLGNLRDYRFSALEVRDVLNEAYGAEHFRTIVAEIAVADSRLVSGYPDEADRIYRRAGNRALHGEMPKVAAYARLRQGMLLAMRANAMGISSDAEKARDILDQLARNADPALAEISLIAAVQLARIDRSLGDGGSTDALVARYLGQRGLAYPLLLSSDPIDMSALSRRDRNRVNSSSQRVSQTGREEWVDIGFLIGTDGRVSEVEVLRSSSQVGWPELVIASIESRRYAPLNADDPDLDGQLYRIERYSLNAALDRNTGSGLSGGRNLGARIVRLDITPD